MEIEVPCNNSIHMPVIGFGTWLIKSCDAVDLLSKALNCGYNHFDCAEVYQNEAAIGELFKNIKNRDKIYVTSKLWCTDNYPDKVNNAFNRTLNNLKLDYLDMYLLHNPMLMDEKNQPVWYTKEKLVSTWRTMLKLKEDGKSKNVGVSNFTTKKLEWIMDECEKPTNNQVELHPYLRQDKLLKFCQEHDIVVSGYCTIGNPSLPDKYPSLLPSEYKILLQDETIKNIADKYNATPAQILIKWGVSRGTPVLIKSSSESRMKENLSSLKINLLQEDISKINSIDYKCRYVTFAPIIPLPHAVEEYFDGEYYN